jgi:cobalt/nickel transport system permease protein
MKKMFLAAMSLIQLAGAAPAHAMHISEGILPFDWALFWSLVSMPFLAVGLRRLSVSGREDLSFKPLVGLISAVVFVISCMPIPVPTAGTCSHPCGTAISAILLGPFISIVVAAVALLIQALFLSHGGLTTLGANIMSMGILGSFAGYFVFRALRGMRVNLGVAGFFAGIMADWVTYAATSAELALGIRGTTPFLTLFWQILLSFIPTQLPLGILEGALTSGMIVLLYKKRPDLLVSMRVIKAAEVGI